MPLADSAVGAAQTLTRSSPKSVLNHRAGPSPAPRAGSSARVTAAPGRRPVRRTFRRGAPSSGSWLLLFLPRDSVTCRFRHTSQARKISAEPCSLAALTQRSEAGSEAGGHFQGRNSFPSLQPGVSVHPLSSLSSKRVARTAPLPHCADQYAPASRQGTAEGDSSPAVPGRTSATRNPCARSATPG